MRRAVAQLLCVLLGLAAGGPLPAEEPPQQAPPADVAVPAAGAPPSRATAAPPRTERLDLDPTSIRGNQELPKVLYIVPWKDAGLAQPGGRPLNSLVDEALAPVDREVFRRQMRYFDQLYARPGEPGAGAPPAGAP